MKPSKSKFKNRSDFLDKCLILHCLFEIKGQNHVHLVKQIFPEIILRSANNFFGFCYKLSNFLAINDEYCIWLSSAWTVWYSLASLKDLLSNICLVFYIYTVTFTGGTSGNSHKSLGSRMLHCYHNLVLQQEH